MRAVLIVAATAASFLVAAAPAGAGPSAAPPTGPGALSHFDLARKDCLGTARNTTSKIWYTVANGVLSDVYAPTIDTTNVETMQYLVTDGATFTDLQTRDMTYTVTADATGMVCTVTATAKTGAYQLTTTYLTDPARDSVVARARYTPLTQAARGYRLYVRLDATVGGNGGGGADNAGADNAVIDHSTGTPVPVSYDTVTTTNAPNRDYAVPSFVALRADRPFSAASSGFVGTDSDGLNQLDTNHALAPNDTAMNGNVEQTAAISAGPGGAFTLALGFGTTQADAVATAGATVKTNWGQLNGKYVSGWSKYDAGLRAPSTALPGISPAQQEAAAREYYVSANVVKASEDKTFPGAIVASLTSPWGQAVSAGNPNLTYFGSYREVFSRDLYEAWTALFTDGDLATAQAATRFLLERQQLPDGSLPRNSLVNGKLAPDSFNTQLDEVAYPILMVLQSGLAGDDALWPRVQAAANYLIAHGPSFGPERWEEQSGYSPSTIAAEIAGLVAAATIARDRGDAIDARIWFATADQYQRSIKGWTVTTSGPLSQDHTYFIRLSKTGDPNAAISYNVGNGGPTLDQRSVIDAGFLELVRLGELPADDPDVLKSLPVVDATIMRQTANGPGWLRYNGDGYGDCYGPDPLTDCDATGRPWAPSNRGTGHIWPVLAAERGEQELATGSPKVAAELLAAMDAQSSGVGLVPEQVWDAPDVPASPFGTDPTQASIGFVNGKPDGSAAPLTWGSASQVRLMANLTAGRALEQPAQTVDRYITHTQKSTTLTVTSPPDQTAATTPIHVAGTTVPGATVDVADVTETHGSTHATTTAAADGSFAFDIQPLIGNNVLVITSTAPDGGTAQAVRTVVNDVVEGTLLFDSTDPDGDDNGPGNYAYPTSTNFQPGAYDLEDFQVYDTGSTVTFRVKTRDLTPTFGSPLGAQLVDVYVHEPNATPTSTAASFPQRNYQIAPADAWSRLLEVQGFGQRFVDASNTNTVGTITISANQISRYITFSVDKSALGGTPASGWSFTVVLTGQDGFSPDQARGFQPTPQEFQFGVCATVSTDPHCTFDPNKVPKAMDVLTPTGVTQSNELDYTLHQPVVIQGVSMP